MIQKRFIDVSFGQFGDPTILCEVETLVGDVMIHDVAENVDKL